MKATPLFILLIFSIFLQSCGGRDAGPQAPQAMPFPVIEIPLQDVTGFDTYPASIEGTVNSAVRAKITGYITEVLIDEGQAVKKGQPLFRLETLTLTQEAGAALANVQAAQVEVERLKPLVEKNIISEVQLQTAQARLNQAKASLNSIRASIDYATIKSPVNGYAGAIPYRVGALVSPADPRPLTTVTDIDQVYAFFAMNERDYLDFVLNAEGHTLDEKIAGFPPVRLELVNGSMYAHEGRIETVSGQVNPQTGTVRFRAVFPNANRVLANGNSGRIHVPVHYNDAVVVPEVSTFEQQGIVYVYKVQGDTTVVLTPIETTDRVNNLIVVASGITAGDKIIAEGIGKLRHGAPVIPQPIDFDSFANSLNPVFK